MIFPDIKKEKSFMLSPIIQITTLGFLNILWIRFNVVSSEILFWELGV